MEGHCSTGQRPQWAVVPMEDDEEEEEEEEGEEEGGEGEGGGEKKKRKKTKRKRKKKRKEEEKEEEEKEKKEEEEEKKKKTARFGKTMYVACMTEIRNAHKISVGNAKDKTQCSQNTNSKFDSRCSEQGHSTEGCTKCEHFHQSVGQIRFPLGVGSGFSVDTELGVNTATVVTQNTY